MGPRDGYHASRPRCGFGASKGLRLRPWVQLCHGRQRQSPALSPWSLVGLGYAPVGAAQWRAGGRKRQATGPTRVRVPATSCFQTFAYSLRLGVPLLCHRGRVVDAGAHGIVAHHNGTPVGGERRGKLEVVRRAVLCGAGHLVAVLGKQGMAHGLRGGSRKPEAGSQIDHGRVREMLYLTIKYDNSEECMPASSASEGYERMHVKQRRYSE